MNDLERRMIRWYWRQVGGTLVEAFPIVARNTGSSPQVVDGLIVRRGKWRIADGTEISLEGHDLIVLHACADRLNLGLMGRAYFAARLVERLRPQSVYSVALVARDDAVLRPLLEECGTMKVVVCPDLRAQAVEVGAALLDEEAGE
jgi:hypothetical protein